MGSEPRVPFGKTRPEVGEPALVGYLKKRGGQMPSAIHARARPNSISLRGSSILFYILARPAIPRGNCIFTASGAATTRALLSLPLSVDIQFYHNFITHVSRGCSQRSHSMHERERRVRFYARGRMSFDNLAAVWDAVLAGLDV